MHTKEELEKLTFDVRIKSGKIDINEKGISYEKALEIVEKAIKDDPENQWLKEAHDIRMFGFMSRGGGGNDYSISAYKPRTKGESQTCGRRMSDFGPWERKEGLDTWDKIGEDRVCSFCGSLHPDDFVAIIKLAIESKGEKADVSGTDKGYKFYAKRAESHNASIGGIKFYTHHIPKENTEEWLKEANVLLPQAIKASWNRLEKNAS